MSGFIGDGKHHTAGRWSMSVSSLGGGLPGGTPPGGLLNGGHGPHGSGGMEGGSARGRTRNVLRRAFGNSRLPVGPGCTPESAASCAVGSCAGKGGRPAGRAGLTPFRAATSAGDPQLANQARPVSSAACLSAPNQVTGTNRSLAFQRSKTSTGGVIPVQGGSWWTGNPKYVYDASDYSRFKRLQANNRNYNDKSFGGDQSSASQVPRAAVRRGF